MLNTCNQNLWSLIICDVQPENITTTTEWHRRRPPPRGPASVFCTPITWRKHRESSPGTGAAGTRREYRARLVCYAHSGLIRRITQQPNTSDIRTESDDVIHHSRFDPRASPPSNSRQSPRVGGHSHAMVSRWRNKKVYTMIDVIAIQKSFTPQTHHRPSRGHLSQNTVDGTTIVDLGPCDTQENLAGRVRFRS